MYGLSTSVQRESLDKNVRQATTEVITKALEKRKYRTVTRKCLNLSEYKLPSLWVMAGNAEIILISKVFAKPALFVIWMLKVVRISNVIIHRTTDLPDNADNAGNAGNADNLLQYCSGRAWIWCCGDKGTNWELPSLF